MQLRSVVAIAGPAGSGKDSIIRAILARHANTAYGLTTTTRAPRPGEVDGVHYRFLDNARFLLEVEQGNIPEHYYRAATDTYYGLYKPDLDAAIRDGKIVFYQIQIVGAKYLKSAYNATTLFIMPPTSDAFEQRVRARAPMSDAEWQERLAFTKREIEEESPWYDHRITNEDNKLEESVQRVIDILKQEGYDLK